MIPMLSCLFCKRKRRLFKIYKIYGRTERPITSYIINFFGDVEEYLKDDHGICSACVFLLNKLIYIKNYMFKTIVDDTTDEDNPFVSFTTAYKLFLHNLDKLNFDDGDIVEEENVSDLLKATHSTPCDSYSDTDYEYSSDRNTPYVDQEVEKVFRKARRKRRRKSHTVFEDGAATPLLRYDKDGRLLNKRTRSVSRMLNAMQEEEDMEHKERFCDCLDCQKKKEKSIGRENVSHHELLAKYWCSECRSGRFTALEDFVHDKASEEMTTFCRFDYDGEPQNPPQHISQNTTGDFNVKVLVQAVKLTESPILQFHDSPDVTSSENTDTERVSANSIEANSLVSEKTDETDLDTVQEELSSETRNVVNRSVTSSSTVEESARESIVAESIEERGSVEEQESILDESTEDTNERNMEGEIFEESTKENQGKERNEEPAGESIVAESVEERGSVEEQELIGNESSEDTNERNVEGDILEERKKENRRKRRNEESESIEERESIAERESIEEDECKPSAFETERIVRDIIESSPESRASVSEVAEDVNDQTVSDLQEVNRHPPTKQLRVILERLQIDLNPLNVLQLKRKSPKTPTLEYMTRRRSNRSRSSNYAESQTEIAENNVFSFKRGSPSKQSKSPNTVSVQNYFTRSRTFVSDVHAVRTDTETDTNDSAY